MARFGIGFAAFAALALSHGAATAAPIVDVDNWGAPTGAVDVQAGSLGDIELFQTFTMTTTGRLTGIELDGDIQMSNPSLQRLTLYSGGDVSTIGTTLEYQSQRSHLDDVSGPFLFDVSLGDLRFFAGDVLTFKLTVTACGVCSTRWFADAKAGYAGGTLFEDREFPPGVNTLSTDLRFRTFVDPEFRPTAPVPEPATWGLMILGFGAAGAALRRRHALSA